MVISHVTEDYPDTVLDITFKELSPPLPNSAQNNGPNATKIIQIVSQMAGIQLVNLKSFWKAPICLRSTPRSFQYNTHTYWGYDLESREERGVWKPGKGDCHQTSPHPTDWIRNYVRNVQCFPVQARLAGWLTPWGRGALSSLGDIPPYPFLWDVPGISSDVPFSSVLPSISCTLWQPKHGNSCIS